MYYFFHMKQCLDRDTYYDERACVARYVPAILYVGICDYIAYHIVLYAQTPSYVATCENYVSN